MTAGSIAVLISCNNPSTLRAADCTELFDGWCLIPYDPALRAAMFSLAQSLHHGQQDREKALTSLVNGAIDALPGWHYASISVAARDGSLKTLAATDQWIVQCDDFQGELRQGPCYDALIDGTYTFAVDLRHDGRWPDYGPMVANLGITSQMALFLSEEPGLRASLNLYAKSRVDLDQDALEVAQLFANAAAGVLGMVRTVEQLTEALATRRTIGQAMGIVMERYTIDDEQAFRFLTRLSQTTNTRLRLVAEDLVRGALGRAHSSDLPMRADRTD